MQNSARVLVYFKSGDQATYHVSGHDDFIKLTNQVSSWMPGWIFIGSNSLVRKSEISQIYYLSEDEDGPDNSSYPPQQEKSMETFQAEMPGQEMRVLHEEKMVGEKVGTTPR